MPPTMDAGSYLGAALNHSHVLRRSTRWAESPSNLELGLQGRGKKAGEGSQQRNFRASVLCNNTGGVAGADLNFGLS
jgi:hypothetical protein